MLAGVGRGVEGARTPHAAIAGEAEFLLNELYSSNGQAFDLAMELMKDWRLDRDYGARIKLCHAVLEIPEVVQKN